MKNPFGSSKPKAPEPTEDELIAKNESGVIIEDEKKNVLYKTWLGWRKELEPTPAELLAVAQEEAKNPNLSTMERYAANGKVTKMKASMKINAATERQKQKMARSAIKSALSSVESAVVSNLTAKLIVALYETFATARSGLRGRIDGIKAQDEKNLKLMGEAASSAGVTVNGAAAMSEAAIQKKYESLLVCEEPVGNLLNILGALPCTYRFDKGKKKKKAKGLSEMEYIRRGVCKRFCKALFNLHEVIADNAAAQNKIKEMKDSIAAMRSTVQNASDSMDAAEAANIERLERFLARLDDAGGESILDPTNEEGMKFASREVMYDTTQNVQAMCIGDLDSKKEGILEKFKNGLGSVGKGDAKDNGALADQFLEMFEVADNLNSAMDTVKENVEYIFASLQGAIEPELKNAKNTAQKKIEAQIKKRRGAIEAAKAKAEDAQASRKAAQASANSAANEQAAKLREEAEAFKAKLSKITDPNKKIEACASFMVKVVEGGYDVLQIALGTSVHAIVLMVQGMALADEPTSSEV